MFLISRTFVEYHLHKSLSGFEFHWLIESLCTLVVEIIGVGIEETLQITLAFLANTTAIKFVGTIFNVLANALEFIFKIDLLQLFRPILEKV